MSAELSEPLAGWEAVRTVLGEIRAGHEGFEQFFAEVFDQLQGFSRQLVQRQSQSQAQQDQTELELKRWSSQLEQQRAELSAQRGQLDQAAQEHRDAAAGATAQHDPRIEELLAAAADERAELRTLHQRIEPQLERLAALAASAGADGHDHQQLAEILGEIGQDREELRAAQQAAQNQGTQLATIAAELMAARDDLIRRYQEAQSSPREAGAPAPDPQLQNRLRQMEVQQLELEQERKILEAELETVRNRAAEMAELLADQKRQVSQQQHHWAEEIKRMRCMLETIMGRLAEAELGRRSPDRVETPVAAGRAEDPVLDSVMAQFEMLQKDLARRRTART